MKSNHQKEDREVVLIVLLIAIIVVVVTVVSSFSYSISIQQIDGSSFRNSLNIWVT